MAEKRELDTAGCVKPVEEELSEPLLVDPMLAVRPDRERIPGGQAVMDDLVPSQHRVPAVGQELLRERSEDPDQIEADDGKEECLAGYVDPRSSRCVHRRAGKAAGTATEPVGERFDVLDHLP